MTKFKTFEFKLLFIIILYRIIDWITTLHNLGMGCHELNPFVHGIKDMLIFEVLMLSLIIIITLIVASGRLGNTRIPGWFRFLWILILLLCITWQTPALVNNIFIALFRKEIPQIENFYLTVWNFMKLFLSQLLSR